MGRAGSPRHVAKEFDGDIARHTIRRSDSFFDAESAVAFGLGTVFDVGDVAPYTPVTVPALTGAPTVMNGEVHVTDTTWTLRAADVVRARFRSTGVILIFR